MFGISVPAVLQTSSNQKQDREGERVEGLGGGKREREAKKAMSS